MATCCGMIRVSVLLLVFFFFRSGSSESSRCIFPTDFSHRNGAADSWLQSRSKRQVLEKWDNAQWATIHQRLEARSNSTPWDAVESETRVNEYLKWATDITPHGASIRKFEVAYMERPWWRDDSSQSFSSFAAEDLELGKTVLSIPDRLCLTDVVGGLRRSKSLDRDGAPWEVRLAAKLLRERASGPKSRWASYIKLLPRFISLPMLFSELEMLNVQDKTLRDEVDLMRAFAKSTYQSLREGEIAKAKFGDYVWALSVVYSSVCQVEKPPKGKSKSLSHYLVPFFSANSGNGSQVYVKHENGSLKLDAYDVKRGTALNAEYSSTTLRDTFLFRGIVPKFGLPEKIKLFDDLLDLVDWYSSTHEGVNHNRYLTLKLAQDAMDALTGRLRESDPLSMDNGLTTPRDADFSVGGGGYVDNLMLCIFATLVYAKHIISGVTRNEFFTTIDFVVKNGSTPWEGIMEALAHECVAQSNTSECSSNSVQAPPNNFEATFSSARSLIQSRLTIILNSFSTNIEEDKHLLSAAAWEGMTELEADQLPCPSCRWQTEQMSYHDNLAVQFRVALKSFISQVITELDCGASGSSISANISSHDIQVDRNSSETTRAESLQEFLNWCQGYNLIISDKLAITDIPVLANDSASDGSRVYRGVIATDNIHQGEVLCTLPMNVGLFNNDSKTGTAVDAWDLAAARLLREKWLKPLVPFSNLLSGLDCTSRAKGEASHYAPYIAILPEYLPTPIHLESQELSEVQWLPMVRELVQVRKSIKESFERLSVAQVAWADFPNYKWAVTMVHSRAFTLPVRPVNKYEQYVLMPFMDMINHHYHYQADWMSQDIWDSKLDIVSRRPIKKGEEVFASFGPRSNDNLFLYYGFLLEDNPFDLASIFGSFEEALQWFLKLWSPNCVPASGDPVKDILCEEKNWQLHWHKIKDKMEDIESGSAASGREWAELMRCWADLGYQFLPYQPGPTIYPKGVIDPGLLLAFSTMYEAIENVTRETGAYSGPWPDPCPECGNTSALGSSALRKIFDCVEDLLPASLPRGLLLGGTCQPAVAQVLLREQQLSRGVLLARVSVALRCSEILASFSTTLDQDQNLLDSTTFTPDCTVENSLSCKNSKNPSRHMRLTWRYRHMKKRFLKAPIDKILNIST